MSFAPGRVVLRRHFMRGRELARVWTGHVAADDGSGLWLWIADGSAFRDIGAADGRTFRDVPFGEWGRTARVLRDQPWRGDVLMLHPTGAPCGASEGAPPPSRSPECPYSVWFFFAPDGRFRNWYVNLERPAVRWDDGPAAGIDTVDYDLDLVVAPDRSWRWKDEAEFAAHLAHPDVYWVDDADAVWASGWDVVKLVETGAFPFDGTGCDFRPDPAWPVPRSLPPGWDRPQAW